MRFAISAGAAAILAFGLSAQAQAATFGITGSTSGNENSCLIPIFAFVGEDCSYNASRPSAPEGWVGPFGGNGYYASNPGTGLPDASLRTGIPVSGSVTIDGSGETATISMSFTFGAAFRNYDVDGSVRAVESWDSITHVIAPTMVTSATQNDLGGWDYFFGTMPTLIFDTDTNQLFPSDNGSGFGVANWQAPGNVGIAIHEGNTGVASTATLSGYQCEGGSASACTNNIAWNSDQRAAFGNILMRITTNADGVLVDGFAILVDEMALLGGLFGDAQGRNSWQATTMYFVPVPGAVWLFASALALMAWIRRRATV